MHLEREEEERHRAPEERVRQERQQRVSLLALAFLLLLLLLSFLSPLFRGRRGLPERPPRPGEAQHRRQEAEGSEARAQLDEHGRVEAPAPFQRDVARAPEVGDFVLEQPAADGEDPDERIEDARERGEGG